MSNFLCFDIETGPTKNAASYFDPSEVKLGNIKDEAKREAKIEDARKEFTNKAALNPVTGKVLAVGFSDGEERRVICYESERETITETLKEISDQLMAQQPVIGWNILNFDFPFLFKRAMVLRVEWPQHIWDLKKGYPHSQIIDLMRYWAMGNRMEYSKMDTVNRFLGGFGKPSGVTGADFARLFHGTPEQREKAIEYLLNDMAILEHLTQAMLNT